MDADRAFNVFLVSMLGMCGLSLGLLYHGASEQEKAHKSELQHTSTMMDTAKNDGYTFYLDGVEIGTPDTDVDKYNVYFDTELKRVVMTTK